MHTSDVQNEEINTVVVRETAEEILKLNIL